MARQPKNVASGLPTREQILEFVESSDQPAGKREIARAFGLKGAEKITLKALLRDMTDEGLLDMAPGRAFHKMGGVPRVTVLKIISVDDDQPLAVPERWEADGIPPPKIRIIERGRRSALGLGDRILARTEEAGKGYRAYPIRKLAKAHEEILGVVEKGENGRFWLKSVDKRARFDTGISDIGNAAPGDLVLAELHGRGGKRMAKVTDILGDPFAPKAFSMIAIHKYGIPHEFADDVEEEAGIVATLPINAEKRENLRHLPIIAIDPRDARDFDDAIWAAADNDPGNAGGFHAIICIADVSYYVRPGSKLDREAQKRGNSVYFPDQVVPMLPHKLSSDKCSLREGEDRAVLACHLVIDKNGVVTSWRFSRAIACIAANIPYEDAQAAIDGKLDHPMLESALRPLWQCWHVLHKARMKREPLSLDLPERRIILDDKGRITSVAVREMQDANHLVEDFMIAANVAAAKALEAKKSPLIYRAHEEPSREKLVSLKEYLKSFDLEFALGQVIRPSTFNMIINRIDEDDNNRPQIMEAILRSQTQAYYSPRNVGHFGLSLGSYAHFTSPIRRYADLIVHRALVGAYGMEMPKPEDKGIKPTTALNPAEIGKLDNIAENISRTERRAMEAERETVDRYVAAYLSQYIGEIIDARITGVQNFGFFATVDTVGGDGLVPVSTLGPEYYHYDEGRQALTSEDGNKEYHVGMRLKLRLVEANPVSGALRFELPSFHDDKFAAHRDGNGRKAGAGPAAPRRNSRKGGRPANIRQLAKTGRKKRR